MKPFSSWHPLTAEGVRSKAPEEPCAIQVRRQQGLVNYPNGKSAMVWYGYGARGQDLLRREFEGEIASPGQLGQGPLLFRYLCGGDEALETINLLAHKFRRRFGRLPILLDDEVPPTT